MWGCSVARKFSNIVFPDDLDLRYPLGAGKTLSVKDWHLKADFRVFWTNENGKEKTYTVKAGLITDMSSIPWFVQGLPGHQKAGRNVRPSIVHDDMYERQGVLGPSHGMWPRRDVDRFFYHMLRAEEQLWLVANDMYYGVRIGGQRVWDT